MIRAILFDMGGVVSTDLEKMRYTALSELSEDKLSWKDVEKRTKPYEHRFDVGLISANNYWKLVAKCLKINNYNNVKEVYFDSIKKAKLNKKVIQLAKRLKEKKYKIGILSNTNELDANVHKKRGDYSLFSPVILSYEVGCRKPENKIYQIALKKLKVKPNECILIDNNRSKLLPARKLGIKTILFKSANQLKKELNKLLIKAIIFDHGGVILTYSGKILRRSLSIFLRVRREKIDSAYKAIMPEFIRGKITEKEFWKKFAKFIGIMISQSKWENFFKKDWYKQTRVKEEMNRIVISLKKTGYKIALLSNTIKPHVECAKKMGFYKMFPIRVLSCEVGLAKPDKEIYFLILRKLKVNPEGAVFIADSKEHVVAAEKAGINAILFRNISQLKKDLLKHGIHGF